MQPASSSTSQKHSAYETATPADRELLVDIELFDAKGHWKPRNIVFCAAQDPARAKKMSARCFRGLMSWYGKLWAKNYLKSHFKDKPESNALLKEIKQTGFIDNRAFRETVLRCTLLYEDLGQVAPVKLTDAQHYRVAPSIKNIDELAVQYFFKLDWRQYAKDEQFEWITPAMARNIAHIIGKLKPSKENDEIVKKLQYFMIAYEKWYKNPPEIKKEGSELLRNISREIQDKKYQYCEIIADKIFSALDKYDRQLEHNKIVQEEFIPIQKSDEENGNKRELMFWKLSEAKIKHPTNSSSMPRRVPLVPEEPHQVVATEKS
jgi:hypothetical protein